MKSLNQQIFDRVLEPMFPGEFKVVSHNDFVFRNSVKLDFPTDLEDAFWLAEKVGLFTIDIVLTKEVNWTIKEYVMDRYDPYVNEIAEGETPQEAICKAILEIYGKKN